MHSIPLGNGLTTESHSHRVIPGSEQKQAGSDSDEEGEAQGASEVPVAYPSEHLVRWNEMTPAERASALQVFHMMSDSDCGESKSERLGERLSGTWRIFAITACCPYTQIDFGKKEMWAAFEVCAMYVEQGL